MKLTKKQVKDDERIDAWLKSIPFQENARSKAIVPSLSTLEVLNTYTPAYPEHTAQFFTPLSSAEFVSGYVTGYGILDPCAGIGSLICPLYNGSNSISAWEMDQKAYDIGSKLFPDVNWTHGNAFEIIEQNKAYDAYDVVVMNPPFNIKWGLYEAEKWSISGAKKSEHLFMELAIRALIPGGILLVILPSTFMTTMPRDYRLWLYNRIHIDASWPMKNDFRFTKTSTYLHHITKDE